MADQTIHDKAVEIIARILCRVAGISEVDLDGGTNWWMFAAEADALVTNIEQRFPSPPPFAPPPPGDDP